MPEPKGAGILALLGAPKGASSEASSGEPSGKALAMQDMMSAMKSGDWEAAGEAFKRAYDECAMSSEGESEGEVYEE